MILRPLIALCLLAAVAHAETPTRRQVKQYEATMRCLADAGVPRVPMPALELRDGAIWPVGSEKDGGSAGACCYIVDGGRKVWGYYRYRDRTVVAPAGGLHVWPHELTHHATYLRFGDLDYDHNFARPGKRTVWACWWEVLNTDRWKRP